MTSGPYRYPAVRAGSLHSAKRRGNDRPRSDLGNQGPLGPFDHHPVDGGKIMNYISSLLSRLFPLFLLFGVTLGSLSAAAQDRTALDNDVHAAISQLLETSPAAKRLASSAKGALVFPNIVKAGFLVGVQYGEGALVRAKQGSGY